ncbi:hypothetical protein PDJAM_G00115480 [Pangasius djambal]|uniref:Uncharacterized protein n=1 Tax=Pangasius djambal TaxID=1691987 RepID=A0ACC5ZAL4_9TELE|nr:hypothetical protein [Pangasius djambal]
MSEEAISESDLEPSLNSEEEEEEEMGEEGDGENDADDDGDDEDEDEDEEADQAADAMETEERAGLSSPTPSSHSGSSAPSSRPLSRSSSKSTSRPSSPNGSRGASAAADSAPKRKSKKKSSKPAKPAHLRRNIRKLLEEHQLEPGTKAAQQEELERRKRLEQQRKDYLLPAVDLPSLATVAKGEVICLDSSGDEGESRGSAPPPKPAPRDDVIELSSGDEETFHISEEDDERSTSPGTEESSGSHINDALNQPDAQGRVLVNINHPAEEEDLFLAPQLARAVKPHQVNTLQNWLAEFNLWLPAAESLPPDTDPAQVSPRTFRVHLLNDEHKTTVTRAKVVEEWTRDGGVLLMGYEMYRLLSLKKSFVTGRKRKSKKPAGPIIIDLDEEDRQQELMKDIEKALSRPGPDVVICDEGHRIKNCHASTSQALKNIRSRRRVVLTGYPLQNNLLEYWCMVDFVRPDFLGTRQEFSNMFERPILNGQCIDSTPQDVRLMRYRSHVLHSLLEGFVQRRGHDVLRTQLPSKEEHVILVRLSPLQRALYKEFMNRFREAGNSGWLGLNPLKAFCVCCKIWNHPDVLYEALQKENLANEQDLDLDDLNAPATARCPAPGLKGKTSDGAGTKGALAPLQERANQVITYEWAKDIMSGYQTGVLENSDKMVLLFHLIEESVSRGDKILVFSQSLSTLSVIESFLAVRAMPIKLDNQKQNWIRGINYYRLDGSTSASERERLINQFNDPANTTAWVFLLSTRAGCLGVNLIGANRVVVLDASWNPCHDAQAVCRVYRYGQRKPCYIYRLVCDFTLEKKIYDRQVSKQGMSDRVVDDLNPVLTFTRKEVESLLHYVEEEADPSQSVLLPNDDTEPVIKHACLLYPHLITKPPFQHESLLMDRKDLKLTKAEKKAAKKSYEDEKRASVPYQRPSYAHYYPANEQSLSNIRNWRPAPRMDEKPIASVRPVQSTPIPMMPRQVSVGGHASSPAFPVNYLQKAGVLVQRIITTTDIVIPGTNSSTDVQARISAGESIHVIKGSKGTYIRTNDGRIFAIRSGKPRANEGAAPAPRDVGGSLLRSVSNGRASPPELKRFSPDGMRRVSPSSSPNLLHQFHHYTPSPANDLTLPDFPDRPTQHGHASGPQRSDDVIGSGSALDAQSLKRKLLSDSRGSKRTTSTTASANFPGFPVSAGYTMGSMGFSPALLGALGHMTPPMVGGTNRGHFLTDLHSMFPTDTLSSAHGSSSSTSIASSSSAPSSSSSSSSSSIPPFLFNPMLSGFPMPYAQPLLPDSSRMFSNSLSSSGSAPAAPSSFLSSSSLLGAALSRPDTRHTLAENGGSSSDDDVIEVIGQ